MTVFIVPHSTFHIRTPTRGLWGGEWVERARKVQGSLGILPLLRPLARSSSLRTTTTSFPLPRISTHFGYFLLRQAICEDCYRRRPSSTLRLLHLLCNRNEPLRVVVGGFRTFVACPISHSVNATHLEIGKDFSPSCSSSSSSLPSCCPFYD